MEKGEAYVCRNDPHKAVYSKATAPLHGMIGGFLWGRAVDRWPKGITLAACLGLGACGALTSLTHNFIIEFIGAALLGLNALIAPALIVSALLKHSIQSQDYATSFSILTAFFAIGQIIGPVIGGGMSDSQGLAVGIGISAIFLGAAALLAVGFGYRMRRNR